jgi:hypothetical protein
VERRSALPDTVRTGRYRAEEALVRLFIRLSKFNAIFVVATPNGASLVSRGRDPVRAVEALGVTTGQRIKLVRVWWTEKIADAVALQLAFAATLWPSDELIPAVLSFARDHAITLTSDTVVQAKARDVVEWVDADFESLRSTGRMKNWAAAFGREPKDFSAALRRAKIRTLYRIAQMK